MLDAIMMDAGTGLSMKRQDTLPHCPGQGPIFHRGAPWCHWGATRSPGCTDLTMKSVGVNPSQPEMQNLVKVEISALKSNWGALQGHEISTGVGTNYPYSIGVWDLSRRGYTIFLKFLWGAPRCTPVHPGRGSELGCYQCFVCINVQRN